MLIAIEKETVYRQNHLSGIELKNLLNTLKEITGIPPEKINFVATYEKMTIVFKGDYEEALKLLEKYPNLVIRSESLEGTTISWKNIYKVILKEVNKINAQKIELEIETEGEDIAKTKNITATAIKCLKT